MALEQERELELEQEDSFVLAHDILSYSVPLKEIRRSLFKIMPAPKKTKCRNCKGEGRVYPATKAEEPCYRCVYDPVKKKNCGYCEGKGHVLRTESLLCCHCDEGWVYE